MVLEGPIVILYRIVYNHPERTDERGNVFPSSEHTWTANSSEDFERLWNNAQRNPNILKENLKAYYTIPTEWTPLDKEDLVEFRVAAASIPST
jgi:hypothetical protein